MIIRYLKLALRHLVRNKLFSLINIFGLSVSIASFAAIVMYIRFEVSFVRFHENSNEIYRVGLMR